MTINIENLIANITYCCVQGIQPKIDLVPGAREHAVPFYRLEVFHLICIRECTLSLCLCFYGEVLLRGQ